MHHANAATPFATHKRTHFGQQVQAEEHLPVAYGGQARRKAPGSTSGVLFAHCSLGGFPFHAIRRIGSLVFKGFAGVHVHGQCVAIGNVGRVLAANQHVGLADGVGFVFKFLAKQLQGGMVVEFLQVLLGHAQNAAGARCRVVHGAHNAGHRQGFLIATKKNRHHQLDHVTRGVLLTGGRHVIELAQQFFKGLPHVVVGDHGLAVFIFVAQVGFGKVFDHAIQAVFRSQLINGGQKAKLLENVPHVLRKTVDHGFQIGANVMAIRRLGHAGQRETRDVEECITADRCQHLVQVVAFVLDG